MESPHHQPGRPPRILGDRVGFDLRPFIDVIALLALLGTPTLVSLAAAAKRPYLLTGLALTIPVLAATPIALARRHGQPLHRQHTPTPRPW